PQNLGLKSQDRNGPVGLYNGMTNAHAINLLSPRTKSLLRLHAKAIGVNEARLASDLFAMMVREAQSLQLQTVSASADKRDRFAGVVAGKLAECVG
ncbi:MAG: hypothetical protein WCD59_00405, partial [Pseudolabrys sp.]